MCIVYISTDRLHSELYLEFKFNTSLQVTVINSTPATQQAVPTFPPFQNTTLLRI